MEWDHPFNVAVSTVEEVLSGQRDVVFVKHDERAGCWHFYDGTDMTGRPKKMVPKGVILLLDPTLAEVTSLPAGWQARRSGKGWPWTREPSPPG
jgi:hypothetical protein